MAWVTHALFDDLDILMTAKLDAGWGGSAGTSGDLPESWNQALERLVEPATSMAPRPHRPPSRAPPPDKTLSVSR